MRRGFTLLELLVVIALIIISAAVAYVSLAGKRSAADLTATTQQIGSLLRQAQNDAMTQKYDVAWGVHFSNATATAPFYVLFTTSYSTATVVGSPYLLPPTVSYVTSTLNSGATLNIIFSSITGTASASTSIGLYMPEQSVALSSTISIASSGSVSY